MAEDWIRFDFNPEKALEALIFVANERPNISFYYIVKILYYADKDHLNRYGRPILGDRYIAMEHGPVPSVVYDMLGRDEFLDEDLISRVEAVLEFGAGRPPRVRAKRRAKLTLFFSYRSNVSPPFDISVQRYVRVAPKDSYPPGSCVYGDRTEYRNGLCLDG
jgi:hypothetical protein